MHSSTRLAGVRAAVLGAVALGAGLLLAPPASAAPQFGGERGAVFVATDATEGNRVVAYDRAADGSLHRAGTYPTGGSGGVLDGAVVDHTASQGALTADPRHGELYAVNAGSDTLSVFAVHGDRLRLRQVIGSGGSFPVSVTVHGDQVFVLDARDGGAIQGYRNVGGRLVAIRAWHRALGLDPAATPEFTHTPGQVAFTPDGRHLVVTTKANTSSILVFTVGPLGALSGRPVVRAEDGTVPFAVAFDARGHLLVTDAGPNAVATYSIRPDGTLVPISVTPTGQAATCWIAISGRFAVASNAGSGTVTRLALDGAGRTTRLGETAAGAGTVDASFTRDGRFLYVQSGAAGQVTAFAVQPDGTLASRSTVTVPDAVGAEGIVAW
jgi:6-phosphogluconolactonase (cycloisomerase 2 family)